jgi:hypothetical protein
MRHFVQMSCCAQFPRWLAGYSVCVTIAAQIGKAPMKKCHNCAKNPKSRPHPTYLETIWSSLNKGMSGVKIIWDKDYLA